MVRLPLGKLNSKLEIREGSRHKAKTARPGLTECEMLLGGS